MLEPNFTFIIEYKWPSSGQTTDQRDPGKELWAEQTLWVAQVPGEDVGLQTDSTSWGSTAQAVTLRCLTFGTLITGSPFCILQNTWKWISTSCIWKSNGPICTETLLCRAQICCKWPHFASNGCCLLQSHRKFFCCCFLFIWFRGLFLLEEGVRGS